MNVPSTSFASATKPSGGFASFNSTAPGAFGGFGGVQSTSAGVNTTTHNPSIGLVGSSFNSAAPTRFGFGGEPTNTAFNTTAHTSTGFSSSNLNLTAPGSFGGFGGVQSTNAGLNTTAQNPSTGFSSSKFNPIAPTSFVGFGGVPSTNAGVNTTAQNPSTVFASSNFNSTVPVSLGGFGGASSTHAGVSNQTQNHPTSYAGPSVNPAVSTSLGVFGGVPTNTSFNTTPNPFTGLASSGVNSVTSGTFSGYGGASSANTGFNFTEMKSSTGQDFTSSKSKNYVGFGGVSDGPTSFLTSRAGSGMTNAVPQSTFKSTDNSGIPTSGFRSSSNFAANENTNASNPPLTVFFGKEKSHPNQSVTSESGVGKKLNPAASAFVPSSMGAKVVSGDSDSNRCLFVRLSSNVTINENDIRTYFSKFGSIMKITHIPPKFIAFIEMESAQAAQAAKSSPKHENWIISVDWDRNGGRAPEKGTQTQIKTELLKPRRNNQPMEESGPEMEEEESQAPFWIPEHNREQDQPTEDGLQPSDVQSRHPTNNINSQPLDSNTNFVVGTCTTMCPKSVAQDRMQANQVELFEQVHPELPHLGQDPEKLVIMKYTRPEAGRSMDNAEHIRTEAALDETARYLWENILDSDTSGPDPRFRDSKQPGDRPTVLAVVNFLMDRVQRIIQEIALQGYSEKGGPVSLRVVKILEECARCHIIVSEELYDEENWSQRTNNESLNKTLKHVFNMYQKATQMNAFTSENECEMYAYYVLLQLSSTDRISSSLIVQDIGRNFNNRSALLDLAHQVYEAFCSGDFFAYFEIFRNAPYLFACLMRRFFNEIREIALTHLNGACKQRSLFPLEQFARMMCFDSISDAQEYCAAANIKIVDQHLVLGQNFQNIKNPPRSPCLLLKSKRHGKPRRIFVEDPSRNLTGSSGAVGVDQKLIVHDEKLPMNHERKTEQEQREAIARQEQLKLLGDEEHRKQIQRVKEEEEHRKALERERVQTIQRQAEEKAKEEARLEEQRKAEEEKLRRAKEEELRKSEKIEQIRREERRQRQCQALGRIYGIAQRIATTQACRNALETWSRQAKRLQQQEQQETERVQKERIQKAATLCKHVKLRIYFRRWRRIVQIHDGVNKLNRVLGLIAKRRYWRAFVNELSMDESHREKRFRRSVLNELDPFPAIPLNPSPIRRTAVGVEDVYNIDWENEQQLSNRKVLDLLNADKRRYWKVCLICFEEDIYSSPPVDFSRWIMQNFTAQSDDRYSKRLFVNFITTDSSSDECERAALGADAIVSILSDKQSLIGSQLNQLQRLETVANRAAGKGTKVPSLLLSLSSQLVSELEQYLQPHQHHLVFGEEIRTRAASQLELGLRWLLKCAPARPQIQETPFETLILREFPRLKGSSYRSPVDWLVQGNRVIEDTARRLHDDSLHYQGWPPPDVYQIHPEYFPSLVQDWSSVDRVTAQTRQLMHSTIRIDTQYTFEDISLFAQDNKVNFDWLEQLIGDARGDGFWAWEQLVRVILRAKTKSDWVAYEVITSEHIGKAKLHSSLLNCSHEPPHFDKRMVITSSSLKRKRKDIQSRDLENELSIAHSIDENSRKSMLSSTGETSSHLISPTHNASSTLLFLSQTSQEQARQESTEPLMRLREERKRQEEFLAKLQNAYKTG